jgi:uncharacterized protein YbdZ (MbtH family)
MIEIKTWPIAALETWLFGAFIVLLLLLVVATNAEGTESKSASTDLDAAKALQVNDLIELRRHGLARDAHIATGLDGAAIAVWEQSKGAVTNIMVSHYKPGGGWGSVQSINSDDSGAGNPRIAMDRTGNAMVVWHQFDGERFNIWANRYAAGTGWSKAQLIELNDAGNAFDPQVTIDINGDAIAVWEQFDGKRFDNWTSRYTVGAGWDEPHKVEAQSISAP